MCERCKELEARIKVLEETCEHLAKTVKDTAPWLKPGYKEIGDEQSKVE